MVMITVPPAINNQKGAVLSLEYAILSVIAVVSAFSMGTAVQHYIARLNGQFLASTDSFIENLIDSDADDGGRDSRLSDGDLPRHFNLSSASFAASRNMWTQVG